jgi:hypothetical protein
MDAEAVIVQFELLAGYITRKIKETDKNPHLGWLAS